MKARVSGRGQAGTLITGEPGAQRGRPVRPRSEFGPAGLGASAGEAALAHERRACGGDDPARAPSRNGRQAGSHRRGRRNATPSMSHRSAGSAGPGRRCSRPGRNTGRSRRSHSRMLPRAGSSPDLSRRVAGATAPSRPRWQSAAGSRRSGRAGRSGSYHFPFPRGRTPPAGGNQPPGSLFRPGVRCQPSLSRNLQTTETYSRAPGRGGHAGAAVATAAGLSASPSDDPPPDGPAGSGPVVFCSFCHRRLRTW